jgi:hypothetical protein
MILRCKKNVKLIFLINDNNFYSNETNLINQYYLTLMGPFFMLGLL